MQSIIILLLFVCFSSGFNPFDDNTATIPCTCGAFLDGQFLRGSLKPDQENSPIFSYVIDDILTPRGEKGKKLCTAKCVELALKYAPQAHDLLCSAVDTDIYNQKVHLFIKNHDDKWCKTKYNSGKAFSCKDGFPVKNV